MNSLLPADWLYLERIVRFGETDSAGVIHFYQLLRWCHESWEESLERYGLKAADVFPNILNKENQPLVALPIIHCEADFWKPLQTGDHISIELLPKKISAGSFQVTFKFKRGDNYVAQALIQHQAINSQTRSCCELSTKINSWLAESLCID